MARKRQLSIFFWLVVIFMVIGGVVSFACNIWVVGTTKSRVFASAEAIGASAYASEEPKRIGLVLGTSKKVDPHTPNQHFENRLQAAASLLESGIADRLLVSGHRDSKYYDETRDMTARLLELGVAADQILADDLGARTFDSVYRAKEVFDMARVIIVSDDFHVGRALFIADRLDLDAIALASEQVDPATSQRVRRREYLARIKAVLDLYWLELSGQRAEVAGLGGSDG